VVKKLRLVRFHLISQNMATNLNALKNSIWMKWKTCILKLMLSQSLLMLVFNRTGNSLKKNRVQNKVLKLLILKKKEELVKIMSQLLKMISKFLKTFKLKKMTIFNRLSNLSKKKKKLTELIWRFSKSGKSYKCSQMNLKKLKGNLLSLNSD